MIVVKIDAIIATLKSTIGGKILEHWGFSTELIDVAKNSNNWTFQSSREHASYVDITIVASIHSYIGKKTHPKYPPFDQIPAFKKIGAHGLTPEESQAVLHEAQHQLDDLKALLCPQEIPILH